MSEPVRVTMDEASFLSQFHFQEKLAGAIGIEREYFLTDHDGMPVPCSPEFLERINDSAWTYELSACQVEHRTKPEFDIRRIVEDLNTGQVHGETIAQQMDRRLVVMEVAPEHIPLDIYPHDERYRTIAAVLPRATLKAACQVTGVHIHHGVANMEEAIVVHNKVVRRMDEFIAMGDHSGGERMRLYRIMAEKWHPPIYESVAHVHAVATEQGYEDRPRNCWHLVRISAHGTVELRMFGMTGSAETIATWVRFLKNVIETG